MNIKKLIAALAVVAIGGVAMAAPGHRVAAEIVARRHHRHGWRLPPPRRGQGHRWLAAPGSRPDKLC